MNHEILEIANCYDSHVHWAYTGEVFGRLQLGEMLSLSDLKELKAQPEHFVEDWLFGFGWDQEKWLEKRFPTREDLDLHFPNHPVCFSRCDGHAFWLNTEALKRVGMCDGVGNVKAYNLNTDNFGGKVLLDKEEVPTGVFIDRAMDIVSPFLPERSSKILDDLLLGQRIFNSYGVTHIRDLSGTEKMVEAALEFEASGQMSLAVETYLSSMECGSFEEALGLAVKYKSEVANNSLLRILGVKIYFDGALGSEGALISGEYSSGSGNGLQLITEAELKASITATWKAGLEISVHVIGDLAVEKVVTVVADLWKSGLRGTVALEHVELMQKSTIDKIKDYPIRCYLQPSHWLSDQAWLHTKFSSTKPIEYFPWRKLEEQGVPIFFGSDSPIVTPDPYLTVKAIEQASENGIPKPITSWYQLHSHPDKSWTPNTVSKFDRGKVKDVSFKGERLVLKTFL